MFTGLRISIFYMYRFLFGKNKIMARALGTSVSDELETNLCKLTAKIVGQCGLLFTNRDKEDIIQYVSQL